MKLIFPEIGNNCIKASDFVEKVHIRRSVWHS